MRTICSHPEDYKQPSYFSTHRFGSTRNQTPLFFTSIMDHIMYYHNVPWTIEEMRLLQILSRGPSFCSVQDYIGTRQQPRAARYDLRILQCLFVTLLSCHSLALQADLLGIFDIPRGSCNSSPISFATKKRKCGQSNRAIRIPARVLFFSLILHICMAYRAFYILNWIYRYFVEKQFSRWISCVSGLVQTALYADFFYYYFLSWKNNAKLQLPA
ncbi:hypothetical protein IFM89_001131 [Coptis chinensis]|uniref:Uncharacterized protein n=1 Tax=Coptis chinensis TaxID=261450 RepID=A0A835IKV0_9MAGN|nr:hypothetical protein IFM89_001131 [Coptis chinensis]